MSRSIYLSLVFHSHQPVGNFGFVFERATREAYEPMIRLLEEHPAIKVGLHYSGCLLDWMFEHERKLIERIRALVKRGQVEILTGGYYEPILVAIPDRDKQGQIAKLSQTIREEFGYEPVGAWLAERVWEQHLAKDLYKAGVHYTIVDDTHFKYAGVPEEDLFGYYITEEQGKTLAVFSTLKSLRYSIPWSDVDSVIDWLLERADESGRKLALMGDDGEKFGMWPGTYEHCWGNGKSLSWMESFFSALERETDIIKTITPAEYLAQFPALGRIYLPTASYDEMSEWVLPVELGEEFAKLKNRLESEGQTDTLKFLRGGFWRNFMVKYSEINVMHKKMLYVSDKINRYIGDKYPNNSFLLNRLNDIHNDLNDNIKIKHALDYLWAGQCNCPYWHGVFGGIYLFHIRSAIYENLIEAEKLVDELSGSKDAKLSVTDFDCDSEDEILFEGRCYNLYISPSHGGACFELDWKAKKFNLLNTLTRRKEIYHSEFLKAVKENRVILAGSEEKAENIHTQIVRVKESGLEKRLFYDPYKRLSFMEHFVPLELASDDFYTGTYTELGNFADSGYRIVKTELSNVESRVVLEKEGHVLNPISRSRVPVRLRKIYSLYNNEARVKLLYTITNTGKESINCFFGVETSWAMMGGNDHKSFLGVKVGSPASALSNVRETINRNFYLDEIGEIKNVVAVTIYLKLLEMKIDITTDGEKNLPFKLLQFYPIETISNSEGGFERIYQGLCMVPLWGLKLSPEEKMDLGLQIELKDSSLHSGKDNTIR